MSRIVLIIASISILLSGTDAFAAGRRQPRQFDHYQSAAPQRVPYNRPPPDTSRYPKFIGGFHSREFQNIGIPSGDIGLRGNGMSMYPW